MLLRRYLRKMQTSRMVLLPMVHDEKPTDIESPHPGVLPVCFDGSDSAGCLDRSRKTHGRFQYRSCYEGGRPSIWWTQCCRRETNSTRNHRDFWRRNISPTCGNGLNIPAGPKRDRFKEIKKRLSQLGIAFSKNLNEEKGGIWLTADELHGIPEDVLSLLRREDDKYWLTFKVSRPLPNPQIRHK